MPLTTEDILKRYLQDKVSGFGIGEWRAVSAIEKPATPDPRGGAVAAGRDDISVAPMEIGKGKSNNPGISVGSYHLALGRDGKLTLLNKSVFTTEFDENGQIKMDESGHQIINYKVIKDPDQQRKIFDGIFVKLLTQPNIQKELEEIQANMVIEQLIIGYAKSYEKKFGHEITTKDGEWAIYEDHYFGLDDNNHLVIAIHDYLISLNGSEITVKTKPGLIEVSGPKKLSLLKKCLSEWNMSEQTFVDMVEAAQHNLDEDNALDLIDRICEEDGEITSFNANGYPSLNVNGYIITSGVEGKIKVYKDEIEITGADAKAALRIIMKPFDDYHAALIERRPAFRSKSEVRGVPGVEEEHTITTSMKKYLNQTQFPPREQPHYKKYLCTRQFFIRPFHVADIQTEVA